MSGRGGRKVVPPSGPKMPARFGEPFIRDANGRLVRKPDAPPLPPPPEMKEKEKISEVKSARMEREDEFGPLDFPDEEEDEYETVPLPKPKRSFVSIDSLPQRNNIKTAADFDRATGMKGKTFKVGESGDQGRGYAQKSSGRPASMNVRGRAQLMRPATTGKSDYHKAIEIYAKKKKIPIKSYVNAKGVKVDGIYARLRNKTVDRADIGYVRKDTTSKEAKREAAELAKRRKLDREEAGFKTPAARRRAEAQREAYRIQLSQWGRGPNMNDKTEMKKWMTELQDKVVQMVGRAPDPKTESDAYKKYKKQNKIDHDRYMMAKYGATFAPKALLLIRRLGAQASSTTLQNIANFAKRTQPKKDRDVGKPVRVTEGVVRKAYITVQKAKAQIAKAKRPLSETEKAKRQFIRAKLNEMRKDGQLTQGTDYRVIQRRKANGDTVDTVLYSANAYQKLGGK